MIFNCTTLRVSLYCLISVLIEKPQQELKDLAVFAEDSFGLLKGKKKKTIDMPFNISSYVYHHYIARNSIS